MVTAFYQALHFCLAKGEPPGVLHVPVRALIVGISKTEFVFFEGVDVSVLRAP